MSTAPGLDYETTMAYSLRVTGTDQEGLNGTGILDVTVTDEAEPPEITSLAVPVSVLESVTTGVSIFSINASDSDGDTITFSMTSSPNDGKFTIDGASEWKHQLIVFNTIKK